MEELGSWIEPVWPDDRSRVMIDSNLPEVAEVLQWLAERSVQQEGAVDDADDPSSKLISSSQPSSV